MPQASDDLRATIIRWFGDMDVHGPLKLLESQGFVVDHTFMIFPPTPSHSSTHVQWDCVEYLITEWDFGYGGK